MPGYGVFFPRITFGLKVDRTNTAYLDERTGFRECRSDRIGALDLRR